MEMNFLKYLGLLVNRAAQKSVLLTDRLTILIVPFTTLALWIAGADMTDNVQETLFLGVAMTVLAVVVLRLVAASYFVWKDDQAEKGKFTQRLSDPERQVEIEMKSFTTELRKELSGALGQIAAAATQPKLVFDKGLLTEKDVWSLVRDVDRLINQLSYDVAVRIASIQFRNACVAIMAGEQSEGRWFYKQRQITFRILHKDDIVNDILSLMELEIELEKRGEQLLTEGATGDDNIFQELKNVVHELGDKYYDPDVRSELKDAIKKL